MHYYDWGRNAWCQENEAQGKHKPAWWTDLRAFPFAVPPPPPRNFASYPDTSVGLPPSRSVSASAIDIHLSEADAPMPAPTALLRRPEELAEDLVTPLPQNSQYEIADPEGKHFFDCSQKTTKTMIWWSM